MAYDPVGAMGGLFAPAYIAGNPESEAATSAWNAANLKMPPQPSSFDVQAQQPTAQAAAPSQPTQADWASLVAQYNAQGGANGSYRVQSPLASPTSPSPIVSPQRDAIAAQLASRF